MPRGLEKGGAQRVAAHPTATRYDLAGHVRSCIANQYVVFLDLKRDAYLCVDRSMTPLLETCLHTLSTTGGMQLDEETRNDPDASKVICDLESAGVLTSRKMHRPDHLSPTRNDQTPATDLRVPESDASVRVRMLDVLRFTTSAIRAAARLRFSTIDRIIASVSRRSEQGRSVEPADFHRARKALDVFSVLRPFFPKEYLCLFDSLALLNFLAHYDVFPRWIFAVKMDPFAAHCWIQEGSVVLNDSIEYVRNYTPIMSV